MELGTVQIVKKRGPGLGLGKFKFASFMREKKGQERAAKQLEGKSGEYVMMEGRIRCFKNRGEVSLIKFF